MPITYTATIPMPNDIVALSQNQILNNFGAISELINVNHGPFNTANFGKHIVATFPNLAAPAAPTGGDINVFNQTDPAGNPNIYSQKTGGVAVPWTEGANVTLSGNNFANGFSYIPSGYQIKIGTFSVTTGGPTLYPFPTINAYPAAFPNACIYATCQPLGTTLTNIAYVNSLNALQTDGIFITSNGNFTVSYLAIGY